MAVIISSCGRGMPTRVPSSNPSPKRECAGASLQAPNQGNALDKYKLGTLAHRRRYEATLTEQGALKSALLTPILTQLRKAA